MGERDPLQRRLEAALAVHLRTMVEEVIPAIDAEIRANARLAVRLRFPLTPESTHDQP